MRFLFYFLTVFLFNLGASNLSTTLASSEEGFEAYKEKDFEKAFSLLQEPAYDGNLRAQGVLGMMYFEGEGAPENWVLSYGWFTLFFYREPTMQEEFSGMYRIYNVLETSLNFEEVSQAEQFVNNWADNHPLEKVVKDFSIIKKGKYQPSNDELKLLAQKGNAEAQTSLGIRYMWGSNGLTKDLEGGIQWLNKATEKGYYPAMGAMSLAYRFLLEEDLQEGGPRARTYLMESYKWQFLESLYSPSEAEEIIASRLSELEEYMVPAEIERAKNLAYEWQRKVRDKNN